MKFPFTAAVLSVLLLTTTPSFGQQAEELETQQNNTQAQIDAEAAALLPPLMPPFPEGVKYGFVNLQVVAGQSDAGQEAGQRIASLQQRKEAEIGEMQETLQAEQQKLQSSGSVMSVSARLDLERRIERQDLDLQRTVQDAQQEVQELTETLQVEFQDRLIPALQAVAEEKSLHFIFDTAGGGLIWGDPSLDLTPDVIETINASQP
jgi:Skp family chaperone for outer membrane proteins